MANPVAAGLVRRADWLSGIRDVVFPFGTWARQWHHHVAVALPS